MVGSNGYFVNPKGFGKSLRGARNGPLGGRKPAHNLAMDEGQEQDFARHGKACPSGRVNR